MTDGQERATAPYWRPFSIDGKPIDLSHLEPIQVTFDALKLGRKLTIDVRFSNHCFTDHFDDERHDPSWLVMDHNRRRVFCRTRYALSANLPMMVRSLPTKPVWQTRYERNYVYFIEIEDPVGDRYPMFFHIKKDTIRGSHLSMMIESAYPVSADAMNEIVRSSNKVAFPVLCAKVFQDQVLRFNSRR